jgi:6-phosphogluconolactonase (cycloisomerase 2 family)
LGEHGDLPGGAPIQAIFPTINTTGPVVSRQDASYSHHVLVDPKNKYILVPDLGGDRIRVFTRDPQSIAPIKEIVGLVTAPGVGPRHAVFKTTKKGETFLFFNGEIDQNIYSYRVEYTKSGPKFTKISSIVSVSADYPATKAPTSEIAISVSLRHFNHLIVFHEPTH